MKIDLSGKIAVVTGSSGELGRVMALTLAECGADVALQYHTKAAPAEAVKARIIALGRKACAVQADITDRTSIEAMRDVIRKELGNPDIVVTSANNGAAAKPVLEQAPEDYLLSFRSAAIQNVLMAQVFVPSMIEKKWGRIIAISTECVMQALPTQSTYVAGKKGMDGMLRILAKEIGMHGITVNQVAPGWTISEEDRINGTEKQDHYDKHVPLRRRGEDKEIAQAVAFLASDLASFITGLYLPVCGGNVMPAV